MSYSNKPHHTAISLPIPEAPDTCPSEQRLCTNRVIISIFNPPHRKQRSLEEGRILQRSFFCCSQSLENTPPLLLMSLWIAFNLFWVKFEADDWCVTGSCNYMGVIERSNSGVSVCKVLVGMSHISSRSTFRVFFPTRTRGGKRSTKRRYSIIVYCWLFRMEIRMPPKR